jgi:hypothetical protein
MPLIQARYFLLGTGADPINCQVDSATKIQVEVIIQSEYPVPEEVNMAEISIADVNTGICIKKFRWQGACALRTGVTYTIDTPIFGPIPKGTYGILTGWVGEPLSRSLGECGINLAEVAC